MKRSSGLLSKRGVMEDKSKVGFNQVKDTLEFLLRLTACSAS